MFRKRKKKMMNDTINSDCNNTDVGNTINRDPAGTGKMDPGGMRPEDPAKRRLFRIAALLSFVFSYLYARFLMDWSEESFGIRALVLTVLMIGLTEWFADTDGRSFRRMKEKGQPGTVKESYLTAAAAILEAAGFMVGDPFAEDEFFPAHVFHVAYDDHLLCTCKDRDACGGPDGHSFPARHDRRDILPSVFELPAPRKVSVCPESAGRIRKNG
jgi:hypothetical protein